MRGGEHWIGASRLDTSEEVGTCECAQVQSHMWMCMCSTPRDATSGGPQASA